MRISAGYLKLLPVLLMCFTTCGEQSSTMQVDDSFATVVLDTITTVLPQDDTLMNKFSKRDKGKFKRDESMISSSDTILLGGISFSHKRITINGKKFYVVEGDMLLDQREYSRYRGGNVILRKVDKADTTRLRNKLIGEIRNNQIVKWPAGQILRYAVIRQSFRSTMEYNIVRQNMRAAALDWEKTCNVKFKHEQHFDNRFMLSPPQDLTFIVAGYKTNNSFIASAFYPYDPPEQRRILLDPFYFSSDYDLTGVLRHELGHVLGWRHEHISDDAPAVCANEIVQGTIPLTGYDASSVMHYFCGKVGSKTLLITETDRKGAQLVYGPPVLSSLFH